MKVSTGILGLVAAAAAVAAGQTIVGAAGRVADEDPRVVIRWRDRRPPTRGVLESLGPDGFRWTGDDGAAGTARWTSVREVDGLAEVHRPLLEDGTALWRASSRLERGEVELASPILERLADRWSGEGSSRRRAALAGLLRCRIRLGDPVGAALAALAVLEGDRGESSSAEESGLRRLAGGWPAEASLWAVDPEGEEAAKLRVGLRRFEESSVASEAAWIESVLLGAALPETPANGDASPSPLEVRCRLLRRIDETPTNALLANRDAWLAVAADPAEERWIHARIAAGLSADPDRDRRRRGLLEWLCIPARFPDSVETPLAYEAAAGVAAELGDDDLAWRLAAAARQAAEALRSRPVSRTIP